MASYNEIAEVLAERAGRQYDISFIDEMKVLIDVWDSRLRRDTLERNKGDRVFFRQWLDIELEVVNISELPGFPRIPVMRTVKRLPQPLRSNGILFDFVGSADKITPFRLYSEQHEVLASFGGRYTGKDIKCLWYDGYIYVFNTIDLPWLSVSSVFDNVRAIQDYSCNCGCDKCFDEDKEYPVPKEIQQKIIQSILATELRQQVINKPEEIEVNAPDSKA